MTVELKPTLIWLFTLLVMLIFLGNQIAVVGVLSVAIAGRFLVMFQWEKWLILFLFAFLPFSTEIEVMNGSKISFPAEGVAVLICFSIFFMLVFYFEVVSWLSRQWIFWAVIFFLGTMAWSVVHSSMLDVSLKFLTINTVFIVAGLLFTFICLCQNLVTTKKLLTVGVVALAVFCLFVWGKTFLLGIGRNSAPELPRPFFNDHTHFAATVLLMFPSAVYLWRSAEEGKQKKIFLVVLCVLALSVLISFSRAAWISALVMILVYLILYFRVRAKFVWMAFGVLSLIIYLRIDVVENYLQVNKSDSNKLESTVGEQLKSVTNVTTDVSNMERINRWKCAVKMGNQLPEHGFGPGTYQFQFIPFQNKSDMTRISVKSPFFVKEGRGGTAHSEYLLSFSEGGYPGLLSWVILVGSVFYSFFRLRRMRLSGADDFLLKMVFCGLVGYFIHALFNNFLNTANFALYFWMCVGILMALLYKYPNEKRMENAD